jgi:hypothetical protein
VDSDAASDLREDRDDRRGAVLAGVEGVDGAFFSAVAEAADFLWAAEYIMSVNGLMVSIKSK